MLPTNQLSTRTLESAFLYPDNIVRKKLTEDYEMGGIAIQDPSKGLQYQAWYCHWREEDNAVCIRPLDLDESHDTVLFNEPDVVELAFSFDQNMRWVCATLLIDGLLKFRWYDSAVADYVVTTISGVSAFHCSHDAKNDLLIQLGYSDVLLTYVKAGGLSNNLYVRNQRDRFTVEHLLFTGIPSGVILTNFGMSVKNRMQWRFRPRRPKEKLT